MWAPALLCSLAGSFLQVAAPLGLAGYFWWRRDWFAVLVLFAWAAESLNNVSVYIGDAQRMVLPLFGDDGSGAGHDWHNILGELGWLGATDQLANVVRTASVIALRGDARARGARLRAGAAGVAGPRPRCCDSRRQRGPGKRPGKLSSVCCTATPVLTAGITAAPVLKAPTLVP